MRHVHIGAGKIGLAFAGFFANKCNLTTVLVNRNSDKKYLSSLREKRLYKIEYIDDSESTVINIDDLLLYKDDTDHEVLRALAHEDTCLITTAIGENNLSSLAPMIANGVKLRRANGINTFFIACENGHRCSTQLYKAVNQKMPPETSLEEMGVFFVDCVVDQICPSEPDVDKEGMTFVKVENYREWIVADNDYPDLRHVLATSDRDMKCVSEQAIELYEKRKLWLVNDSFWALPSMGMGSLA